MGSCAHVVRHKGDPAAKDGIKTSMLSPPGMGTAPDVYAHKNMSNGL